MPTKLKLSHEEMLVLAAIADQELTSAEVAETIKNMETRASIDRFSEAPFFVWIDINSFLKESLLVLLDKMVMQEILVRSWTPLFRYHYAIASNILELSIPPYDQESWRRFSE